ncbi:MAG TPA: ubiquinol-cytochrome C chaperone family protein [Rhizomicrobium sp.]|jgi:cytochrome b pre-mRNA-processing protein 3|nr:ubiquinol-cytochrome C chaperone family protein [Rhizomicrobium sp.]
MLNALRRNAERARTVQALHAALTAQARSVTFFREYGVADTIDGRFDMVALHAWLVFGRLRSAGLEDLARGLSDAIFVAFDEGLRDLGTGDMGLGPRMKKLGNAFNGRCQAYEAAAGDETALREAILRNVYRGAAGHEAAAAALARYALTARAQLEHGNPADGTLDFGTPPTAFNGR